MSLPVRYVLYSHFSVGERSDFDDWNNKSKFEGVEYLTKRFDQLEKLLASPAYEGLLVLFYAKGLEPMLNLLSDGKAPQTENELPDEVRFSEQIRTSIEKACRDHSQQLADRVRVITPADFLEIFKTARIDALAKHMIGNSNRARYDTPKIPEAFLRLRLLGTGIPVFRLDQDVLLADDRELKKKREFDLFRPVVTALEAYRQRRRDPNTATFLFSGCYEHRGIGGCKFPQWRGAFATRVFPALPALKEGTEVDSKVAYKFDSDCGRQVELNGKSKSWEQYAKKVFDRDLAAKFLGLDFSEGDDSVQLPGQGISRIGAPPLTAVISGALLCISDGAIMSLPPFSTFSQNVMWIDDHLKYSLHRELGHLAQRESKVDPSLSTSNIAGIVVRKRRPPVENLPEYAFGSYLPSLVLGAVMDGWITPKDSWIKYPPKQLPIGKQERWKQESERLVSGGSNSLLGKYLKQTTMAGKFPDAEETKLKRALEKNAYETVREVKEQWSNLRDGKEHTFASAWASGQKVIQQTFGTEFTGALFDKLDNPNPEDSTIPPQPRAMIGTPDSGLEWDPRLASMIRKLIDETCDYVKWTLAWPTIIQIVRAVPQGSLRIDLDWRPDPEP